MAVLDLSITPRLLECAREEFLNYGYERASIQNICIDAGVTTGALYKRFDGKEGIFCALVEPTVEELNRWREKVDEMHYRLLTEGRMDERKDEIVKIYGLLLEYAYSKFDDMKLLFCKSKGTRYECFLEEFVKKDRESSMEFIKEMEKQGIKVNIPEEDEMAILLKCHWEALCEVIKQDFPKEKATDYGRKVVNFFGWPNILNTNL